MQHDELFQPDRRQFRDRRIPQALLPTLARCKVRAIPEPYSVVAMGPEFAPELQRFLAAQGRLPFSSVSADDRELCAVLPSDSWRLAEPSFPGARVERGYRVLALEGETDWSTPGFLPVIGRVLAEGNIGAGILTGYRRLHLLVKARHVKDARIFLDLLATQARGRLQQGRGADR